MPKTDYPVRLIESHSPNTWRFSYGTAWTIVHDSFRDQARCTDLVWRALQEANAAGVTGMVEIHITRRGSPGAYHFSAMWQAAAIQPTPTPSER